jgi:hypothetical protein
MLENNFKGYYKSSVEAENPSLIIGKSKDPKKRVLGIYLQH